MSVRGRDDESIAHHVWLDGQASENAPCGVLEDATPFGVGCRGRADSRVAARTRQPWAGGCNPVGIVEMWFCVPGIFVEVRAN